MRVFARAARAILPAEQSQYWAFFLGALAIMLNMAIGYELLHAFFWINIGVLLFLVDPGREGNEAPAAALRLPSDVELGAGRR